MDRYPLEELLRALPPAPEAMVRTAQELPFVRAEIASILDRVGADEPFRRSLRDDPQSTLERAGYDLSADVVAHIMRRLPSDPPTG